MVTVEWKDKYEGEGVKIFLRKEIVMKISIYRSEQAINNNASGDTFKKSCFLKATRQSVLRLNENNKKKAKKTGGLFECTCVSACVRTKHILYWHVFLRSQHAWVKVCVVHKVSLHFTSLHSTSVILSWRLDRFCTDKYFVCLHAWSQTGRVYLGVGLLISVLISLQL